MANNFTKFAFTDAVRELQEKYGSRRAYAMMEKNGDFRTTLTWQERMYIEERDSFYLSSVGDNGWPYVQFRGGPKGFLRVIDEKTLGYADFQGNGQYISSGNLSVNNKSVLFLMDYPNQRRLKVWAESEIFHIKDHPGLELFKQVKLPDYKAVIERVIIFHVLAFDWNCPKHIPQKYTVEEIKPMMVDMQKRIDSLEEENQRLKKLCGKD